MLAPLVGLLQRLYFPRIAAMFLVVIVAFTAVFALGGLMASQVNQLANDLPRYESTLSEKIQALRGGCHRHGHAGAYLRSTGRFVGGGLGSLRAQQEQFAVAH